MTVTDSQQDTSDYVSTMNEDLSINDWEYQLPAPPNAFRDSRSPVFDDYDTVTVSSVEVFKEPLTISKRADANSNDKNIESANNLSINDIEKKFSQKTSSQKMDFVSEAEIDIKPVISKPIVKQTSALIHTMKVNSELQKEIISELGNKTGILAQIVNKDSDRKNMNSLSEPKIAPTDNTLSNFTITTYTQQKNLDIFEEFAESNDYVRKSEERFIKTFATLSRNNTDADNYDKKNATINTYLTKDTSYDKKAASKFEELNTNNTDYKTKPKIRDESKLCYKWQSRIAANQKINIQRSKSYISRSSNPKYHTKMQRFSETKHEQYTEKEILDMKKAISITDLNEVMSKDNEKFLQWRHNKLKHQEECTKEKQLQSLQVLKSILPQLKNAQQTEKNASKEYSSTLLIEKARYEAEFNEHSINTNVVSTREFRDLKPEYKQLLGEKNTKPYVYTGPPAISLGSWSERPNVNVQIKMDTDYTLERNHTNCNKTIVNVNSTRNKKNIADYISNANNNKATKSEIKIDSSANKNSDEFARQLIVHTTATDFNIPILDQVNAYNSMENKPVMMGVELKQIFVETPKETNEIDTISVDFRELTKAFGQHVNFKQKPKRTNISRYSADARPDEIETIANLNSKQNSHITKAPNQNKFSYKNQSMMYDIQQTKKFMSVVGINEVSQNICPQSDTSLRCNINTTMINLPMPVVKGFKIPMVDLKMNNNQINKQSIIKSSSKDVQPSNPPTMPVITGVTLKNTSTRSKSMPVQLDPRSMLLESIRNFGGREKLKNVS